MNKQGRRSIEIDKKSPRSFTTTIFLYFAILFTKAEFEEGGNIFANRYPSPRSFVSKKVGNRKN